MHIYIFFKKSLPERTTESYWEKKNKEPRDTFPALTRRGVSGSGVGKSEVQSAHMSPGKWYIYTCPLQIHTAGRRADWLCSPGRWRTFLVPEFTEGALEKGGRRDGGASEPEFTGGLGPGRPQKFCCRRFLASMASRMGCRFDWYFCRISSISCSIIGSRARSLFWRSSTVQLFSYERGRQHRHNKAQVSGFWRQPILGRGLLFFFFFFGPRHLVCGILVPWPGTDQHPWLWTLEHQGNPPRKGI